MRFVFVAIVLVVGVALLLGGVVEHGRGTPSAAVPEPVALADLERLPPAEAAGRRFAVEGWVSDAWRVGDLVAIRLTDAAGRARVTVLRADGALPARGERLVLVVEARTAPRVAGWHAPVVFVVRGETSE